MSEPTSRSDQPPGRRPGEVPRPERGDADIDPHPVGRDVAGVSLASREVRVDPGAATTLDATIVNHGNVVDEFTLTVEGPAEDWATVTPSRVALMPGTAADVVISFRPPRRSVLRAGVIEYAVHAASREVPGAVTIAPGVIRLGAFGDASVTLVPATVRASGASRLRFSVVNQGNAPLAGTVRASDPDELLDLAVAPPRLELEPGGSGVALVTARPRRRTWFGEPQQRLVRVELAPDTGAPVVATSSLVQLPVLGRRPPVALVALGLVGAAAALVAFLALGPRNGPSSSLAPPAAVVAATPAVTAAPPTLGPTAAAPPTSPPTTPPETAPPVTAEPVTPQPSPSSSLTSDQSLPLGGVLVSPDGAWELVLQDGDGNLVIYPASGGDARWASNTSGCGVSIAVMQGDGNFVLYGGADGTTAMWATVTGAPTIAGSWVELRDDGQLVLVSPDGAPLWLSDEHGGVPDGSDPCAPHP